MTFPTPFTLSRKPYVETTDGLGNTKPDFGDTVAFPAISVAAHQQEQGSASITETAVADLDVYAPKAAVSLKDQFTIDGLDYEVVSVADWTMGFHGWQPGIVVQLRRVK